MTFAGGMQGPLAISASGLCKYFPGVTALDEVSLQFEARRITAVLGENGAGKSTLMTILAGLQQPDRGTVTVADRQVTSFTPSAMLHDHGVALVPQEIALCADQTVAENVMLGLESGWLPSRRRMRDETAALLRDIDTGIDPDRRAGSLSVAEQQLVLIVRALARKCRVLILDEPTTSLTPAEVGRLFDLLSRLRASGTSIIYVSHRLPEIFAISDHIHVLRDGRHAASFATAQVRAEDLVNSMVGRKLVEPVYHERSVTAAPLLEVRALSGPGFEAVDLTVSENEIVGVAGLPDSGNGALVAALFGAVRARGGEVRLAGAPVRLRTPRDAMRAGIGYVPAERRTQGLFPDLSVAQNATILDVPDSSRFGVLRRRALRRTAAERLREHDVRGSHQASVTTLSGGNQQKVILSRWLARRPRVLLLDDPTRGVDVGAKAEIHDRLVRAAESGAAVVLASSDLPELLRVCDRIVVLTHGRVSGVLDRSQATEEQIMALATNTAIPA